MSEDTIKQGDTVKVHYTGTLPDGTVFDSSRERDPLEFTLGQGQLIPGFEAAVEGMKVGEAKKETFAPDMAYGPRRDELAFEVPRAQLPAELKPEVGQQLAMQQPSGQAVPVVVASVAEETVTLDANHPLAGKDLTFEIEVVAVN